MATTANFGWPTPDDGDAVSQGAAAIRSLGSAVDATVAAGYRYAGTRYYTSSGTFTKADPLGTGDIGLRAIRVRAQGAGGGGGGAPATGVSETSVGGGGSAGSLAQSLITDISSLAASETVTVGSGGSGGVGVAGGNGGTSSFGSAVVGNGGLGGGVDGPAAVPVTAAPGAAVNTGTGDFIIGGSAGTVGQSYGLQVTSGGQGGNGGSSALGGGPRGFRIGNVTETGGLGSGGGGARRVASSADATGGNGKDGAVIVDCYV